MGEASHFAYVPTARGTKWIGYCAGPAHWILGHEVNRKTKVCPDWWTDGKISCPWCSDINAPVEVGYQPIYRAVDSRPVCVIVHEPVREVVDKLKFHARVIVGREKEASAGVYVVMASNRNPGINPHFRSGIASPT